MYDYMDVFFRLNRKTDDTVMSCLIEEMLTLREFYAINKTLALKHHDTHWSFEGLPDARTAWHSKTNKDAPWTSMTLTATSNLRSIKMSEMEHFLDAIPGRRLRFDQGETEQQSDQEIGNVAGHSSIQGTRNQEEMRPPLKMPMTA